MSDYISRADAIEAVQKIVPYVIDNDTGQWGILVNKANVITELLALPSADATIGDYPNDLISRNALMEYCSNQKSKTIDNNDIARFPSADAEQTDKPNTALDEVFKESHDAFHKWEEDMYKGRPHGEWYQIKDHKIMGEGYLWHCSICDYKVYQDSSKDYPTENYCPNCGALMLKGGDDE